MVFITPFYFHKSYWLIPLFILVFIFRYGKMTAIVTTMEHLVPYESEAYMCLSVVIAYIIDCILGVKSLSFAGALSVAITLLGVFMIADVKLKIFNLKKGLIIRLVSDVGLAYCTRYALLYISNAMFILSVNLIIVFIFSFRYKLSYHKGKDPVIKLVIFQQMLGFIVLYLGNMVTLQSVTAFTLIRPIELALCILAAMFIKNKTILYGKNTKSNNPRTPKLKDAAAISLIVLGICQQMIR